MSSFFRPLLRSRICQLPRRHTQHKPFFSTPYSRSFFTTSKLRYNRSDFLDKIPTSYVYWGILGLNGAVFCLWQAAQGRAVCLFLSTSSLLLNLLRRE